MALPSPAPLAGILSLLLAGAALAQEHREGSSTDEKLGTVHFSTSCSAAAQPLFDRAVALLHSFEFAQAIAGFHATLEADPSCAMAEWGIAKPVSNPFAAARPPRRCNRGATPSVARERSG
jgi:hypothetical protein